MKMLSMPKLGRTGGNRRWPLVLAALCIFALSATVQAAEKQPAGLAYSLHEARPPADALGKDVSAYKQIGAPRYVRQGPDISMQWFGRTPADQRSSANASYPLYRKSMGMLIPYYWSDGRKASREDGWHGPGFAIHYDTFQTHFKQGDDDRRIAGRAARHYVFTAHYVSWAEGDARKEHDDVVYNLWVLPDLPFSWAPLRVLSPDDRVRIALADKLAGRGLVARIDKQSTRFVVGSNGKKTSPQQFAVVAWISDLKSVAPPETDLPIVKAEVADRLKTRFRKDPKTFCKSVLGGATPKAVTDLLTPAQQPSFLQSIKTSCQRHYAN